MKRALMACAPVAALLLAGCGGGGGTPVVDVAYLEGQDRFRVTVGSGGPGLVQTTDAGQEMTNTFRSYEQASTGIVMVVAGTGPSNTTLGTITYSHPSNLNIHNAAFVGASATALPIGGAPTLFGQYGGILSPDSGTDGIIVAGDTVFFANFDDQEVSGTIFGRATEAGQTTIEDREDITLVLTDLTGAIFSGTATGGQADGVLTPGNGSYSGSFIDATDLEVMGTVSITYGDGTKEEGIFWAIEP